MADREKIARAIWAKRPDCQGRPWPIETDEQRRAYPHNPVAACDLCFIYADAALAVLTTRPAGAHQVFPPPPGGWICFHCGQKCHTIGEAELHFGSVHDATPACRLTGAQFTMLQELRKIELQRDEFEVRLNAARLGLDKAAEDEAVERFRADRGLIL